MAHLTGSMAYHSQTSEVDSTQHPPLGTQAKDADGNIYTYVDFQEACVAGEWVTYNSAYAASGMTTTTHGPLGVVIGTVSASDRFGWIQVYGVNSAALGTSSVSTALALILSAPSTDISVPDVATTSLSLESIIQGATAVTAASTATTTVIPASFTVQLNFPFAYGTQTS